VAEDAETILFLRVARRFSALAGLLFCGGDGWLVAV
jgi:hypothetical protein